MKKFLLILLIITMFVTGCFHKQKEKEEVKEPVTTEETPVVEQYVDDNKMPISIYQDGNYVLNRVDQYKTKFTLGKDISVFCIFISFSLSVNNTELHHSQKLPFEIR